MTVIGVVQPFILHMRHDREGYDVAVALIMIMMI